MDPRLLFDIFSAVILLAVAVLGSWLPLHLSRGSKTSGQSGWFKTAYHLGNCLSAGVMLSAGFCHLLADSLKGLAFVGRFPMANFLAALGYLVTLAADQIVHAISHPSEPTSPGPCKTGDSDVELAHGGTMQATTGRQRRGEEKVPLLDLPVSQDAGDGDADDNAQPAASNGHGNGWSGQHAPSHQVVKNQSDGGWQADAHAHVSGGGASHTTHDPDEIGGGHLDVLLVAGPKLHFATAVLLAVALCVHSVLEGMALGAQQSMRSTQDIMLAIAAHKGLAAYALGASVVESGADVKKFWTVTLSFSLATPLAIFIGYGLSTVSSGHGGQALSALASGTFLYVAMMEVIPREMTGPAGAAGPRWMRPAKVASLLFGFGAMSLLAIWA